MPPKQIPLPKIPGLEKGTAFERPRDEQARIVFSLQGEPKTLKSSFPFGGPSPIVVFDIDDRLEGVANPWMDGTRGTKTIVRVPLMIPKPTYKSYTLDPGVQKAAQDEWNKFINHLRMSWESSLLPGGVRTLSIDDASSIRNLRLMAEFGRLNSIPPTARGDANVEMGALMREGRKYHANVVWIHELRDAYKLVRTTETGKDGVPREVEKREKSGERELDGYDKTHYAVDTMLETVQLKLKPSKEPQLPFGIRVIRSGLNVQTNGVTYTQADWEDFPAFAWVASNEKPKTTIFDWLDD